MSFVSIEFLLLLAAVVSMNIPGVAENSYGVAKRLEGLSPIISTLRSAWEQIPVELANISSLPAGNEGHVFSLRT